MFCLNELAATSRQLALYIRREAFTYAGNSAFFKLPCLSIFIWDLGKAFFKRPLLNLTLNTSRLEAFEELPSQSNSDYILNRLEKEQLQ